MARDDRVLRPFWLHQAAEYLLGLVLVALGLQSPTPTVPTLLGGLVLLNAAVVDGPIGAFRLFSRRVHRTLDVVVIGLIAAAAAMPFLEIDNATRGLMIVVAVILLVVWWNSSFTRRQPPTKQVDRGDQLGRSAGRMVGGAVKAFRDRGKG